MKNTRVRSAVAVLVGSALVTACAHMSAGGWTRLIDGEAGLDNWNRVGDANWRAEGGAIVADRGKGGFLVSKGPYKDFEIRAEFWAEANTNSGIFIRCNNAEKITAADCYEVNIWDTRPDPKYGTAAIVDHAAVPVPIVYKAGGRWSTFEITARGSSLKVRFNGETTVDITDAKHPAGPFALQFATVANNAPGGPIKWRKVEIRPL